MLVWINIKHSRFFLAGCWPCRLAICEQQRCGSALGHESENAVCQWMSLSTNMWEAIGRLLFVIIYYSYLLVAYCFIYIISRGKENFAESSEVYWKSWIWSMRPRSPWAMPPAAPASATWPSWSAASTVGRLARRRSGPRATKLSRPGCRRSLRRSLMGALGAAAAAASHPPCGWRGIHGLKYWRPQWDGCGTTVHWDFLRLFCFWMSRMKTKRSLWLPLWRVLIHFT